MTIKLDIHDLVKLREAGVLVYCDGEPVYSAVEVDLLAPSVTYYTRGRDGKVFIANPTGVRATHTTERFGPVENGVT